MIHEFQCASLNERLLIMCLLIWTISGFIVGIYGMLHFAELERPKTLGAYIGALATNSFLPLGGIFMGCPILIWFSIMKWYEKSPLKTFFDRPIHWHEE